MAERLVEKLFEGSIDIVGDIHGEIDALRDLLRHLGYADDGSHPQDRRLVFLGDLTDRGPDSPAVVDLVKQLVDAGRAQCVMGNHEFNILLDHRKQENMWFYGEDLAPAVHLGRAGGSIMEFSHVGMITEEPKPGEVFIEATRVWITDFVKHPHHVEWLRFESDSPVTGPVRTQPHVAYRVESIEEASQGMKVLLEPFQPMEGLRVGFYHSSDGAVIELMEFTDTPFADS